ncbi:hypothetical protein GCM10009593_34580 [Microlunatus antarcticus]
MGEVPLSQPLYGATIKQSAVRFFKKYATFSGRASRSEFWWWYLIAVVVSLVLNLINRALAGPAPLPGDLTTEADVSRYFMDSFAYSMKSSIASIIFSLATFVGLLALSARRLHDTNRSGWWYLIILVPIVGFIILIVFWASAPKPEGQRYDRATA